MSNNSDNIRGEFDGLRKDFAKMRGDIANLAKMIGDMSSKGATDGLDDLKHAGKAIQRQFNKTVGGTDAINPQTPASETGSHHLSPGDDGQAGTLGTGEVPCHYCQGTGKLHGAACMKCEGSGKLVQGIG